MNVRITSLNANVSNFNSSPESSNSDGFVKDEQAAIEIAVREWTRMGLKKMIDQEKPYRAELVGDVWEVNGTAPKNWVGGLAYARISQKDGKVLKAWHDK
ncbi:MAG: NTF2 fold immunity protein [Pyrinomonadaceae bacterium]